MNQIEKNEVVAELSPAELELVRGGGEAGTNSFASSMGQIGAGANSKAK